MGSIYAELNDRGWLCQKYTEERLNANQIAELVKCGPYAVLTALHRSGIHVRSNSESHMIGNASGYTMLDDEVWLRQKYVKEKLSAYQIAKLVGCNAHAVSAALRRGGIHVRPPSEAYRTKNVSGYVMLDDKAWLSRKYEVEMLNTRQIGAIAKCDSCTVAAALRRVGIHVRTQTEAKTGLLNSNFGKHRSKRTRERISEGNKGKELSENHKRKLSVSHINPSAETRRKIGLAGMGRAPWNKGKTGLYSAEALKKMSEAAKGRNSGENHPMWGKKHTEKAKQKIRAKRRLQVFPTHQTKPEMKFEEICTKYMLPFEYTGNSKVWIGSRGSHSINPDFTGRSKGKRFAVFVNGDFWHSQLLRPQLRETQRPEFQTKQSRKHRWVPIILWETDLKRDDAEAFVLSTLKKEGFDVLGIEQQQQQQQNVEQILTT